MRFQLRHVETAFAVKEWDTPQAWPRAITHATGSIVKSSNMPNPVNLYLFSMGNCSQCCEIFLPLLEIDTVCSSYLTLITFPLIGVKYYVQNLKRLWCQLWISQAHGTF